MKQLSKASPQSRRKGFTLVEIMAATGIMLVLIGLVLTLTTNVLSSWTRSTGQLQTNLEARVALDLLTSDLESMVVSNRNICWLQVEYQTVNDAANSPILYLFAPTSERPRDKDGSDDNILGDICAISYRQAYQNPFTGNLSPTGTPIPADQPFYALYRSVVDAENTFHNALALADYDSTTVETHLSAYWNSPSTASYATTTPPTGYTRDGVVNLQGDDDVIDADWILSASNFLSQNIAEFDLLFWYEGSSGLQTITSDRNDPNSTRLPFHYAGGDLYIDGNATPVDGAKLIYVDVSLSVLSSEGSELLNNGGLDDLATEAGFTPYELAISRYGSIFTRRIHLVSSPL